jgi:hypothetical protein
VGDYAADLALFGEFIAHLEASKQYAAWRRDNCGKGIGGTPSHPAAGTDVALWDAFKAGVLAGETPVPPDLKTTIGDAFVDAGKEAMSISHLVGALQNPYPPDQPPPTPSDEPLAIQGQGYSVVFEDDFDFIDTNIWRYQRFDKAEQPSKFSVANSIMTITNSAGDTSIDLMTKAGHSWQYGYFEALMRYTADRASWASLWMMSDRWCSGGGCGTFGVEDDMKICEFDMLESNHQFETQVSPFTQTYRSHFGTAHKNTSGDASTGAGCGVTDVDYGFGFNYENDIGIVMAGQWRRIAGLWTPSTLEWWVDDTKIKEATPWATFDQPMRLFLAMYRHPNEGSATLTTEVDWVKVWQQV